MISLRSGVWKELGKPLEKVDCGDIVFPVLHQMFIANVVHVHVLLWHYLTPNLFFIDKVTTWHAHARVVSVRQLWLFVSVYNIPAHTSQVFGVNVGIRKLSFHSERRQAWSSNEQWKSINVHVLNTWWKYGDWKKNQWVLACKFSSCNLYYL